MNDMSRMEFEQAAGEEFGDAICPPVPFEDASAHECYEVILDILGDRVTPEMLSAISDDEITALTTRFGTYFEVDPPSEEQVRLAIRRILYRWPVGSL
ncbi:hypothetical protein CO671_26505 [Rhizobium sp. M10]|uniref:hypothetical protein n=1 Tax=Rhizobium sp. M10 TaxID=1324586 RepID=UPI000BEA5969|nr:hypothetical protein [Rhizobium sp. M10]PDT33157.1 hypothetical protein CO671_26505 [Rhizobium sp. M10]